MTTLEDVRAYQSTIDDLTTVAVGQLDQLLAEIDTRDPIEFRNLLVELLPGLAEPFMGAAGEVAATWYEELREQIEDAAFAAGVYGARANPEQVAVMARYAVSPLFGQSESTVLNLASGSLQRLIAGAGRSTVAGNVSRDRVRVGYARIPRPGCCAFCSLLASRGAVYGSEMSAGGGNDFHDLCRCVVAPVFRGDAFARDVSAEHRAIYEENIAVRSDSAIDRTATLANMRAATGSK